MIRAAFFDLDGTLIRDKSMISFINYIEQEDSEAIKGIQEFTSSIKQRLMSGYPRALLNMEYFRIFTGLHQDKLSYLAKRWADNFLTNLDIFNQKIVDKLIQHKKNGYEIIIITGSFKLLVKKIVHNLPIDTMLCTRPEIVAEKYTGEIVGPPCIGEGKRAYMLEYSIKNGIDLSLSWAYGDDPSDQYMMDTVANAVYV